MGTRREHGGSAAARLLAGLNEPQREAVSHQDGPLLILAGPGSGKTRVVTHRAAYLASTVTDPRHILAITFTNKAAREMQERIAALEAADGMTVSTFHAFCARLLRQYADRAGMSRNFTILDREDRRKAIKQAVERSDLSPTNWSPAAVEAVISNAKNEMLTADAFALSAHDWRRNTIARIYKVYEKLLAGLEGLDFDDLLMRVAALLEEDDELRERLEDRFRYVLVDEYQDTNAAQYKIARLLTQERQNLCATGDPDQSIYGWRGADISNILHFERDYPQAKVVRLEQNYRSTQKILAAADALIAVNVHRKAKTLWTSNDPGPAIRVFDCEDEREEAAMIAREIGSAVADGADPNGIAVFYRVNSLSRVLEEALLQDGVRYQIARGVEFYNRKEIKDVLAYLRVLVNPSDEISLLRIINTPPRGIGSTTVQRIVERARAGNVRVFDVLTGGGDLSDLGRSADRARQFGQLLRELAALVERDAPTALDKVMGRSGLRAMYSGEEDMDDSPARNLDELLNAAVVFHESHPDGTVVDWLEHAALISDVDAVKDESGRVTLMTLHAAKGLEFDRVYVVGLEDGLLPFRRQHDECDEEEERRLLFVGMTRAKRRLTMSHARFRMIRGVAERTVRSPFLDELPGDELEWSGPAPSRNSRKRSRGDVDRGRLPEDIARWEVGILVRHPVCGLGRVMGFSRGPRRTHVDVLFKSGERKNWVLEFSDLTRVEFDEVG